MATIERNTLKKGGFSYRFKVSLGYDDSGKQIVKTKTWRADKGMTGRKADKEAERQAFLFEEECKAKKAPDRRYKFKAVADEWLGLMANSDDMRASTYERMKQCTERTYQAIGNKYIDEVKYRDIQSFILGLSKDGVNQRTGKGLSPKTQKHYLTFISDTMNYAVKCGLMKSNPCKGISVSKAERKEIMVYSLEEINSLMTKLDDVPLKYKAFFMITAYCGLRRGEVLGLEFKDIDIAHSTLSVQRTSNYRNKSTGIYESDTKTKCSRRVLAIPNDLLKVLQELYSERERQRQHYGDQWVECDRLFIQDSGKPMHPNTPYSWLERFCKREGIQFKSLHAFRHAFATHAITNGVDVKTVSAILGHSQTTTTLNTYTHAVQTANAKAVDCYVDLIKSA